MAMTLRRDGGDGDGGDGVDGDGGDDQPDEEATDPELMADTSPERQLLDKPPGSLVEKGWTSAELLQAHLGTYFSQPVQHGAGNESSGLLGTC